MKNQTFKMYHWIIRAAREGRYIGTNGIEYRFMTRTGGIKVVFDMATSTFRQCAECTECGMAPHTDVALADAIEDMLMNTVPNGAEKTSMKCIDAHKMVRKAIASGDVLFIANNDWYIRQQGRVVIASISALRNGNVPVWKLNDHASWQWINSGQPVSHPEATRRYASYF